MSDAAHPDTPALLSDLSEDQREEIERRGYVRVGGELAWVEPGGRERREPLARLYYVQTLRGIFRVSRLTSELVEV